MVYYEGHSDEIISEVLWTWELKPLLIVPVVVRNRQSTDAPADHPKHTVTRSLRTGGIR
jgi:hypothetical protein